jgi:hypothetical protein
VKCRNQLVEGLDVAALDESLDLLLQGDPVLDVEGGRLLLRSGRLARSSGVSRLMVGHGPDPGLPHHETGARADASGRLL